MKSLKELNKWKKYDVKVEFKELKAKNNVKDYQMIIYFNNEVVYATRKKTFSVVTKKEQKPISLINLLLGKGTNQETNTKKILQWDDKARKRFDNWSKNFRICRTIQETAFEERLKFQRRALNE